MSHRGNASGGPPFTHVETAFDLISAQVISREVEAQEVPDDPQYFGVEVDGVEWPQVEDCDTEDGWVLSVHRPVERSKIASFLTFGPGSGGVRMVRPPGKLALYAALLWGALAWVSPSVAGAVEYVVKPGDTLWKIAHEHGCTVDQLRSTNGLEDEDALRVNVQLDLSPCAKKPPPSASPGSRGYTVRRGDSLARIARKHGTTVSELRRLNQMANNMIHPGQQLAVPGKAQSPIRVVAGQSVGRPTKGKLVDGIQLGRDPGYYRRRLERTYGASHVVDQVRRAIRDTRDLHPKLHRLAIGDLSRKHGGWLSGHKSHQSGRDIDLGLYFRRIPTGYPQEFVDAETGRLDATATWDLVAALVATADESGGVDRIFLDYAVQGKLYDAARAKGVSKKTLREVFQYPDGKYAKHGIVRHEPAHSDHLHVRFKCPAKDISCR